MAAENLDNLYPEDRIKKLKELEKQKKKEIEETIQKIRKSEEELNEKRKFTEKVPIPQVAKDDLADLSEDEKRVVEALKGKTGLKVKEEKKKSAATVEDVLDWKLPEEKKNLEELAKQKVEIPPEVMQSQYTLELSRRPMDEIKREVVDIYNNARDRGYLTREEERKIQYDLGAVEKKIQAGESGKYSFTEDVAQSANLTRQIGAKLRSLYQSGNADYQR